MDGLFGVGYGVGHGGVWFGSENKKKYPAWKVNDTKSH